ncbi:Sensor histidine kinase [Pseudomonas amygdali pv. ulmi]|uniref:histidine kinase n=1 Tax=Pseudomonas amygdali pv. ulmi TaxID=251720 RepID=A0A0Q0F646_PSEA0|nr:Sensor histidine kinase [Pseudomonas amygdali pv. aesculi]KPZ18292.1 Sensor histidine kinase [Pseudomonas amygdali pv. ulmi]RMR18595.1 Sensor histidine kinase [Pseudomonas amygdali pv. ulmi]
MRLHRPVQALALGMKQLDPENRSQRLPVQYDQEELKDIACGINAHLERVEQFMARERALLDQASHEFRTPIAVISGALDVLARQALPACAAPPIQRMRATVDNLTEIMVALLYLSREPMSSAPDDPVSWTACCPAWSRTTNTFWTANPCSFRCTSTRRFACKCPRRCYALPSATCCVTLPKTPMTEQSPYASRTVY